MNSDNETGWKKVVKLETHLKSQMEKLRVKQKMKDILQRGKHSNKKKSKKTRQNISSSSDSEEIQRNKKSQGKKGEESHLAHHQIFQAVSPQQTQNQRLHPIY